jgi:sugar lactone lactonase YvrE
MKQPLTATLIGAAMMTALSVWYACAQTPDSANTQVAKVLVKGSPIKVLVKGSPIHGANGLAFDSRGRLHIASVAGNEIVVMDPATGGILERLGSDKGVYGPDDVAFGPDGSLYWTSLLQGHVGRLAPDGTVTTQSLAPGPNPITFSSDGRLFVGLCFFGDGLFELGPWLNLPPTPIAKQPGMLNGFAFGPDGLLYAPVYFEGRVVRFNVDTRPVTYETVTAGLAVPSAVKFDSLGNLHGLSQLSGEVWRLDAAGTRTVIARLPPGIDNLAFDSRNRLFISHAEDGSIFEILPRGRPRMVSKGGMILPGGVAVLDRPHRGESVFVADLWKLREFNGLTGREVSAERSSIAVPNGVTSPITVSADGENLIVSSWFGNSVQVWNPESRQVVENHPEFAVPLNAVRFQGDLVVAELGTHSLVRVTPAGRTTLTDQLYVPVGLAVSGDKLWVSDWASGMVWQILPAMMPVATGLAGPEGLAVEHDGHLLVVESKLGRLSRIDVTTGVVTTIADGLDLGAPGVPNMPPTWVFNGVAVGPSGAIYVTGDKTNVLYRLR